MNKILGIDVSHAQGAFDFNAVDEVYSRFAIIRAGYGQGHTDKQFEANLASAKALNKPIGLYWYSYALTAEQAKTEAAYFVEHINRAKAVVGAQLVLPCFIDMEDADGYKKRNGFPADETLVTICETHLAAVEAAGYQAGVYASQSWFTGHLAALKPCNRWVAKWGDNDTELETNEVVAGCFMQQFSSNLIQGRYRLDLNIVNDAAAISRISAIETGAAPAAANTSKPAAKPKNPTVKEFCDGAWGRGTTTIAQKVFKTPVDGEVSNQAAKYKRILQACLPLSKTNATTSWEFTTNAAQIGAGSELIKAMQKWLGVRQDGQCGPITIKALQKKLGVRQDGILGVITAAAFQRYLYGKFYG